MAPLFPLSVWTEIGDVLDTRLFSVNGTPITLASVLLFVGGLALALFVARWLGWFVASRLLRRFQVEPGVEYAVVRMTQYVIIAFGAVISLQFVGIDLATIAIVFGFLAVGIGFGLQNLTSNFISGLILLLERPIRVGDRIQIGDLIGDVQQVNIRSTVVRSLQNVSIIVPNSQFIEEQVVNWSHGDPRMVIWVDVGVSYGSDLEVVLRSLREVAREHPEVAAEPPPRVLFLDFGDSSWNMRIACWIADPARVIAVRSELNMAIVSKFRANGVEIPFPQRDLHVRSSIPVPLAASADADADGGSA